jgi:hypothetical protein
MEEIKMSRQEIIEAIKQMRKELQESGKSGSAPPDSPGGDPLLPNSAELKLLRSCQERVNRQTLDLQDDIAKNQNVAKPKEKLDKLAERQREVAEMARKMNERITGQ